MAVDFLMPPDDGKRYQIVAGNFDAIEPSTAHQEILGFLFSGLNKVVRVGQLGKACMLLGTFVGKYEIYQPDILFVRSENLSVLEMDGVHGAPDFVIEILSPSNAYYDLKHKKYIYEQIGVREYWIVDPMERSIESFVNSTNGFETFSLGKGAGRICSNTVPEFCIEVADVFEL